MAPDLVQALIHRVEHVHARRGSLALAMVGEPGIGKSHLGQSVLAGVGGLKLSLHTRAFETDFGALLHTPNPNTPGLNTPGAPAWARQTLERTLAGQSPDATVLATAVGTLLGHAAPVLVWAEDFHEVAGSERATEFWTALARHLPHARGVALLVSSRTPLPGVFAEQRLTPLDALTGSSLLEAQAGGPLPQAALEWIGDRGRGNPLFLLEFFRHLGRTGALYLDAADGRWRWREPAASTLPLSVEALIADHLARLTHSTGAEALLGLWALWDMALPDEPLEAELAASLSGLDLAAIRALRILAQTSGIRAARTFAHPLFREVALRELPASLRRDLARRCVETLEDAPEQAAQFLTWAEWPAAKAAALLRRALTAAQSRGDPVRAADHQDALVDVVPSGERAEAALAAAQALQPLHTGRALTRATQAWQLDPHNGEALGLCARLLASSGRGQEAERLLEEAPGVIKGQPDYWATVLETRVSAADHSGAMQVWQDHAGELEGRPQLQTAVALARVHLGEFQAAADGIRAALEQPLAAAERVALLHALVRAQVSQADPQMFATLTGALEITAGAGLTAARIELLLEQTQVLSWALQLRGADTGAAEAVHLAETRGDPRLMARTQANRAECLILLGQFEEAEDLLLAALELLGGELASRYTVLTHLSLIHLYLEWARPPDALMAVRHARQAVRLGHEVHDTVMLTWVLSVAARAEALHGDLQRAERLIEEGQALVERSGQHATRPFYLFARGHMQERQGHPQAAAQLFGDACEQARVLGNRPFAERFGLEADRLRGDRTSAEARLAFFRQHELHSSARTALSYFPPIEPEEAAPEIAPASLRLEVLGEVNVTRDGQPLPLRSPGGLRVLVRLLEARLAGRSGVAQDELLEALYPDDNPERSGARLRQQVRRLRAALGADSVLRRETGLGAGGGYALGNMGSDAEDFLNTPDPKLWRGAYLADFEGELSSARDVLVYGLRSAAYAAEPHDPREAARLGRILLDTDPFDWAALALSLRTLRESGEIMALLSLYAEVRQRCTLLGEKLPDTWEDFLRDQEMRAF
ncbi:tetratricopeptide repeat protein [Deinococcus marmoris]|uniref:Transcriptional regulator n=1 Tax=Deinococcus marmoris TaxID=249408 RepID=A0A1U7P066_9DEIO|nr:tetratricopeptide repeat protein [Deinococcus marmoris]OLV18567.1 transcriptional regulator [Deinococcus marmoris]